MSVNIGDAKFDGAIDKKFQGQYNYLIDLLSQQLKSELKAITDNTTQITEDVNLIEQDITAIEEDIVDIQTTLSSIAVNPANFVPLIEDFVMGITPGRGNVIPLTGGTLGAGGAMKDWDLRYDSHPGIVSLGSVLGTAGIARGYYLTSAIYSATDPKTTFGASTFINGSEKLTIVFRAWESVAGMVHVLGRAIVAGLTSLPTFGYYAHIDSSLIIRGRISDTVATETTYQLVVNTWYKLVMEVNSAKTAVTFTLYSDAGTELWTSTISATLSTARLPIASIAATATAASAADLLGIDLITYEINRTLTR